LRTLVARKGQGFAAWRSLQIIENAGAWQRGPIMNSSQLQNVRSREPVCLVFANWV
jgi:hypothetical protein